MVVMVNMVASVLMLMVVLVVVADMVMTGDGNVVTVSTPEVCKDAPSLRSLSRSTSRRGCVSQECSTNAIRPTRLT